MTISDVSQVGVIQEITDSISYLHEGVQQLDRPYTRRLNVAALNIATGLERLMKTILILDDLHHDRELNKDFYRRTLSHDIEKGFAEVTLRQLWSRPDCNPPIWEMKWVKRVIQIFRHCSGGARYAYFDHIFSNSPTLDTPEKFYQRFLMDIGDTMPGYNESFGTPAVQAYMDATRAEGVATIQLGARAICRVLTLGPSKEPALTSHGLLDPFLTLRDDQLGKATPLPSA